ncbi:hypothetical protein XA68_10500 [Ophiocordyceps unilateralis]|uniref:ORP1 like protein n=1 Tax=Ophiocordyceps unilateralis TaxID=268505 RepID=A0A2A9PI50_OPHUN|nr:hypothetical protein XA68_10500 [Ophiocordyceps unilateralis]
MDVTLLLNQSAGFVSRDAASRESTPPYAAGGLSTAPSTALPTPSPERCLPSRESEPRQIRGRTPWNAGGYSLPLQSDVKFRSSSTFSYRDQADSDASGHTARVSGVPHSRHVSVDSDMSMSRESVSRPRHSRASASDAGRMFDPSGKRTPSWDEQSMTPRHRLSDSYSSLSSYSSRQSRPHSRISSITTISGSYAGSSLAELPILECSLDERDEPRRRHLFGDDEVVVPAYVKRPPPSLYETDRRGRPASPPDEATLNMGGFPRPQRYLDAPRPSLGRASHLLLSPKLHKRAISAPDFASASGSRFPRPPYNVLPPPHQTMTTGSPLGARGASLRERREGRELVDLRGAEVDSRGGQTSTSGLDSSPELAKRDEAQPEEPVCMYVADCDTGSQLRKAISHLFGRNKSCTLKIPKEVWVYYCRKHYQRIRYRNAREYPTKQMELVKMQIRRLQTWSENNKAKGSGPVIQQWSLSLRKREQNRLESGKGAAGEEREDEHGAHGGNAVPDWIIQIVGQGYTTEKIYEVAQRLHDDIKDGLLGQVPEIEFLPDIVDDSEGASKPARSRRSNASTSSSSKNPKRKAEFSDMSRQNSVSGDVDSPVVRTTGEEDEPVGLASPSGKRARLERVMERGPYRLSMPPYMTPSYNDGLGPAPRAPHVVPKFRPMDYHGTGPRQGESDVQSPPRFGGFQQPLGSLYDDSSLGYGNRFGGGSPEDIHLTLPSIRTQMLPGAPRPTTHQRSASAYTLVSRPMSSFTRPSSSGGHGADEGAAYELGSHGGPQQHQQHQHHGQGQGWAEGYGHGYQHGTTAYGQSGGSDVVSPCSGLGHGA